MSSGLETFPKSCTDDTSGDGECHVLWTHNRVILTPEWEQTSVVCGMKPPLAHFTVYRTHKHIFRNGQHTKELLGCAISHSASGRPPGDLSLSFDTSKHNVNFSMVAAEHTSYPHNGQQIIFLTKSIFLCVDSKTLFKAHHRQGQRETPQSAPWG